MQVSVEVTQRLSLSITGLRLTVGQDLWAELWSVFVVYKMCQISQLFKCARKRTRRVFVVSLALNGGKAPAGWAHLFIHELDLVCKSVSLDVCVCVRQAPTASKSKQALTHSRLMIYLKGCIPFTSVMYLRTRTSTNGFLALQKQDVTKVFFINTGGRLFRFVGQR